MEQKNLQKEKALINRKFTREGVDPYDEIQWEKRNIQVTSATGESLFEQKGVEFPKKWSINSSQIVTSKYFYGRQDKGKREKSLKQLIDRVVNTITDWGKKDKYFLDEATAEIFRQELKYILLNQHAAFNSPVWFNVGIEEKPQCSACFINSVEDNMESILNLAKTEGMIFNKGSGAGSNLSKIRSEREQLSTGGYASGPVSFMRGYDVMAGSIKSGGRTRRAAKMVLLDIEHPDIFDFITSKAKEEKKSMGTY